MHFLTFHSNLPIIHPTIRKMNKQDPCHLTLHIDMMTITKALRNCILLNFFQKGKK